MYVKLFAHCARIIIWKLPLRALLLRVANPLAETDFANTSRIIARELSAFSILFADSVVEKDSKQRGSAVISQRG